MFSANKQKYVSSSQWTAQHHWPSNCLVDVRDELITTFLFNQQERDTSLGADGHSDDLQFQKGIGRHKSKACLKHQSVYAVEFQVTLLKIPS